MLRSGICKLIYIIAGICALSYGVHKVHANDGTASAEVIDDVLTVSIARNVNMGRFSPPRAGENFVIFSLVGDGSIAMHSPSIPAGFSHKGGQSKGIINISGTPGAQVNISTSGSGSFTMRNSSNNDTIEYRFRVNLNNGLPNAFLSLPLILDNAGNGRADLLGQLLVFAGTSPGVYSTTFPVNVSYQ